MTAETIDTSTHRLDLLAHLAVCSPCAALFMFAREHQDLGALDAWRRQLAQHLVAGSGLQFVDKGTHALKGGSGRVATLLGRCAQPGVVSPCDPAVAPATRGDDDRERAGDRGRTGDVQLGNLSAHASKAWTVATISRTSLWCACPKVPSHTPTYYHRNCHWNRAISRLG